MAKTTYRTALASTFLSIANFVYLTYEHYQLHLMLKDGKSICSINAVFDCDAAAASPFATVLNVPVALLGLLSQIVLLILFSKYGLGDDKEKRVLSRHAWLLAGLGLIASIIMGGLSYGVLHIVCLFCSFGYLLSAVTFWASQRLVSQTPHSLSLGAALPELFKGGEEGSRGTLVMLISIPVGALILNFMIMDSTNRALAPIVEESIQTWQAEPQHEFHITDAITLGASAENAKMTIVEFADFQCIHCKMAGPVLSAFVKSRKGARLVFQSYPLDGECNTAITQKGDGFRCKLAKLAFCANKSGKGHDAHDWIFEHFNTIAPSNLDEIYGDLQLDQKTVETCIAAPETHTAIMEQATRGAQAGVEGTPTIYVNGRKLGRGQIMPVLEAAYLTLTKAP